MVTEPVVEPVDSENPHDPASKMYAGPDPALDRMFALVDRQTNIVSNIQVIDPLRWSAPATHDAVDVSELDPKPAIGWTRQRTGDKVEFISPEEVEARAEAKKLEEEAMKEAKAEEAKAAKEAALETLKAKREAARQAIAAPEPYRPGEHQPHRPGEQQQYRQPPEPQPYRDPQQDPDRQF